MKKPLAMSFSNREKWNQVFESPRLFYILFLGFASGLPLMLTGSTLQAWYSVSNVSIMTIGILSLVGQPYTYKFLWAPLLDRYRLPWLGRRRGWILLFQIMLTLLIASMSFIDPNVSPWGLAIVAVAVSFFSSSQDVVIDAYRTEILLPDERGLGAGLNTIGYRISMIVSGALALVLADSIGWHATYLFMAGLMFLQLIITCLAKESNANHNVPESLVRAITDPFKNFLKQKYAISVLVFIVLYKLGDVFTQALGTAFLIRGLGFSLSDVGMIYKLVGMAGVFIGVIIGGFWIKRLSLFYALAVFGIIQAFTNLPFLWLAVIGKNYIVLIFTVFIENLGSGLGSVAFLSFIMALCDRRFTATQFALFSALAATGRVFAGPFTGIMEQYLGWVQVYLWAFLIGFPGILWLGLIKKHQVFSST
jgi:MFS transporter, PAT family, beta-lactamase induction signal transducer AmpG